MKNTNPDGSYYGEDVIEFISDLAKAAAKQLDKVRPEHFDGAKMLLQDATSLYAPLTVELIAKALKGPSSRKVCSVCKRKIKVYPDGTFAFHYVRSTTKRIICLKSGMRP